MNEPSIYILISVGFIALSALITALGYFIRSRFDGIDHQLSCNVITHNECYNSLHVRFAGKETTKERFVRHGKRIDDHDEAIRQLEGQVYKCTYGDRGGDR